jgi:hypothetical protein
MYVTLVIVAIPHKSYKKNASITCESHSSPHPMSNITVEFVVLCSASKALHEAMCRMSRDRPAR